MKHLAHLLSLLAALTLVLGPRPASAEDLLLGTLTSTGTTVNQSTTAVPFTVPAFLTGAVSSLRVHVQLALQCDAPAYVLAGTTGSSLTVSSSTGEYVAGNQWWPLGPPNGKVNAIAVISVSGTANCKVFEVYDPVG